MLVNRPTLVAVDSHQSTPSAATTSFYSYPDQLPFAVFGTPETPSPPSNNNVNARRASSLSMLSAASPTSYVGSKGSSDTTYISPNELHASGSSHSTPRSGASTDMHGLLPELAVTPIQKDPRRLSLRPLSLESSQSSAPKQPTLGPDDAQYAFVYPQVTGEDLLMPSPYMATPISAPATASSPNSAGSAHSSPARWQTPQPTVRGHKAQRSLSTSELSTLYTRDSHFDQDVVPLTERNFVYAVQPQSAPAVPHVEPVAIKSGNLNAGAFVYKLYNMLADPEHQNLICFTTLGTSFIVSNAALFAKTVLPKHFKHCNFSSFVRQCNMYGFHKVNKTPRGQRGSAESLVCEFSHPKFIRGQVDLLDTIKRRAVDDSDAGISTPMMSPLASPNPSTLTDPFSTQMPFKQASVHVNVPSKQNSTSSLMSLEVPPKQEGSMRVPPTIVTPVMPQTPIFHQTPTQSGYAPSSNEDSLLVNRVLTLENHIKLLQGQQSDLSRYAATLQSTCVGMQQALHETLRKQDMLVDLVGNMFNNLQTAANGSLSFGFPADLAEPTLPTVKDRLRPPAQAPPPFVYNRQFQQQTPYLNNVSTTPMIGSSTPSIRFDVQPSPYLVQPQNSPMPASAFGQQQGQQQQQQDLLGLGVQYPQRMATHTLLSSASNN